MNTYNITSENIEIIPISNETALFFHADSLQLYPLTNDELIRFLLSIKQYGVKYTKQQYPLHEFEEFHEFVLEKINSAPVTTTYAGLKSENKKYNAIVLPISAKCNLNCPYCFARTDNGYNFKSFNKQNIDDISEFLVKNKENEHITIIFFGGEPLLNIEIIKYTVNLFKTKYPKQSVNYSITTNGTILNRDIINFFKDNKFSILLSLDGPDNAFNLRKYKNGKSSFPNVMKNIQSLIDNEIGLELRATVVNDNPYILETFDFFENLQIPFNIVFAYNSENKTNAHLSTYNSHTLELIERQLDKLLEYYIDKFQNNEKFYNGYFNSFADVIRFRLNKTTVCAAGINYHTIMSNGDIYSCAHLMNDDTYRIGNINSGYNGNEQYFPIPIQNIIECQNCWIKNICLGGCPSQKISMGKSNNTSMDENNCELEKIKIRFYLKLFYYASKINPNYFAKQA